MRSSCSSVAASWRWVATRSYWRGQRARTRCCIRCSCSRARKANGGWCPREGRRHRSLRRRRGHSGHKGHGGRAGDAPVIKRMTGCAAITREAEPATVAVTIRALNHRYLDLQLRFPQALAAIEAEVRSLVGRRVSRGRVELSVSLQLRQPPAVEVEFNETFGRALSAAIDQARARGLVTGALTP